MNRSLSFSNQYLRIGIVAVILLFAVLIIVAPATGQKTSGSTFNRAPEGYLGWYRYMEERGTPVQRWQRPLEALLDQETAKPQTLLRVYSGLVSPSLALSRDWVPAWLEAGNHLVVLGVRETITEATFTTQQDSPQGNVTIKTRRRHLREDDPQRLGDNYGAVVWHYQRPETTGEIYFAVTPHLAANAYVNEPGNYAFLADLVSQHSDTLWVDEYLHGYKAADVMVEEVVNNWSTYLARTPIKIAVIQLAILLGLLIVFQNRRLGNLAKLKKPQVDNSQAYIEALAAVLHKAESNAFLIEMIAKAERASLQKALGFSEAKVDDATLQAAWTQRTEQSSRVLMPLLKPPKRITKQPDQTLNRWLNQLRLIRLTLIQ